MYADLDALCIAVYCTADDLLPSARANARRKVSDAEPVTLCVARAIMGVPSDRRFLAVARRQLGHLFPRRPGQAGYHKRRRALAETIAWLIGVFADRSPGRRRSAAAHRLHPGGVRPQPRDRHALGPGRCRRLRLQRLPQPLLLGIPAARHLRPRRHPARRWRSVAQSAMSGRSAWSSSAAPGAPRGEDPGGRQGLCRARPSLAGSRPSGATIVRPTRADEPGHDPHLAPIRQRIESIFFTCTDLLTLERHGARTLAGLRERVAQRFLVPGGVRLAQPPARATEPLARGLRGLSAWNHSSRSLS